jgi:diguanylate cyclase (GGDEF)-like protein
VAEEQIHNLAFYDALTLLPNRRLLNDRLSRAMAASHRSGCFGAVMFLDLDNFKPLNDTYGHDVGDLLLIEATDRLKSCVLLSELNLDKTESTTQAHTVAEKIRAVLAEPYLLRLRHEGGADTMVEHPCTASIGVVVFINHEESQEDILRWADAAMYQAKASGRNSIRFYDSKV